MGIWLQISHWDVDSRIKSFLWKSNWHSLVIRVVGYKDIWADPLSIQHESLEIVWSCGEIRNCLTWAYLSFIQHESFEIVWSCGEIRNYLTWAYISLIHPTWKLWNSVELRGDKELSYTSISLIHPTWKLWNSVELRGDKELSYTSISLIHPTWKL